MADDLGVQFFTAANTQHESIAKWHLIALALLAYLHVALVVPFVEQTAKKDEVERELKANQALAEQLAPIAASAKEFGSHVQSSIDAAASDLQGDLVANFKVLNETVNSLATLGPQKAAGQEGEQLFHRQQVLQNQAQQIQQQQLQPVQADVAPTIDPMPADLRKIIAEAARMQYPDEQYFQDLGLYINEHIIDPAFKRANDAWINDRQPGLIDEGNRLDQQLQAAIGNGGTASATLSMLRDLITGLRDRAQSLKFAPPPEPDWWKTVTGKQESIQKMIEAVQKKIGETAEQQAALQTLQDEINKLIPQKERDAVALAEALQDLEQQAKDLQAQLGEIGGPLKVIAVKLVDLAPLLPLIIGFAGAAVAIWKAEYLQRMRFAATLVGDAGQGAAVRGWLRSAAGGSGMRVAAKEMVIGALMIAWVVAAGRTAASLPAPFASHEIILMVAIAAVVAGTGYHWYRAKQALAIAGG